MANLFQATVHSKPRPTSVEKFNSLLDGKASRIVSEFTLTIAAYLHYWKPGLEKKLGIIDVHMKPL